MSSLFFSVPSFGGYPLPGSDMFPDPGFYVGVNSNNANMSSEFSTTSPLTSRLCLQTHLLSLSLSLSLGPPSISISSDFKPNRLSEDLFGLSSFGSNGSGHLRPPPPPYQRPGSPSGSDISTPYSSPVPSPVASPGPSPIHSPISYSPNPSPSASPIPNRANTGESGIIRVHVHVCIVVLYEERNII